MLEYFEQLVKVFLLLDYCLVSLHRFLCRFNLFIFEYQREKIYIYDITNIYKQMLREQLRLRDHLLFWGVGAFRFLRYLLAFSFFYIRLRGGTILSLRFLKRPCSFCSYLGVFSLGFLSLFYEDMSVMIPLFRIGWSLLSFSFFGLDFPICWGFYDDGVMELRILSTYPLILLYY